MSTVREFRPELLPRRGEALAWLGGVGMLLGLYLAEQQWGQEMSVGLWIFAGMLVFFASTISLGNWMDRRSVIRMDAEGISFENGLRSVRLAWPEVQNVAVVPTRLGKRIQVQSAQSHFTFKTMGQMTMGSAQMQSGYADGQFILDTVLKECGMQVKAEKNGMVYYARA